MKAKKLFFSAVGVMLYAQLGFAQQMNSANDGAMMAGMQDAKMAMMQEPNKALAQASVLYMTIFTKSLLVQTSERPDKIDSAYIKTAFAEMKRAHNMIETYQSAHVKTMDEKMKIEVKMMMMKMNTNLAAIQKYLEVLETEVNGKQDLTIIAEHCKLILKSLDDIPKPKQTGMEMPAGKSMMH